MTWVLFVLTVLGPGVVQVEQRSERYGAVQECLAAARALAAELPGRGVVLCEGVREVDA